ncbi:MAG: tRNA (adenosine(37)-N6)-threonylcarbamoyltransferase complex transferase subunit TsaD [Eubacteriales bacterium]|nr:tRNA (adenosine(37)-N6)-threonylcarbamoyltransferase complex transferase subunit TsaD [Eubacteriales bacterium]
MLTLGIETSCDETSVAVIDDKFQIRSNVIISQIDIHQAFGGVVPEIAARNHIENILPVLDEALKKANLTLSQIDQVAATTQPGLPGAVMVGRVFGRSLANALDVPFVAINHLHGHMSSLRLSNPDLQPPMLCLLVSGGHTILYRVNENWETQMLCTTADDAVGEAFDKVARVLGLAYPGGPKISEHADMNLSFKPILNQFPKNTFSYSGLKTAVLNYINREKQKGNPIKLPEICANFQYCAVLQLLIRTREYLQNTGIKTLGICGGVSANRYLREQFQKLCDELGVKLYLPKPELCGDNAAMIASAAVLGIK